MAHSQLSEGRREELRAGLPLTIDLLRHRRASEIDESVIDDLVSLAWLEWNGGALQPTVTGMNICQQQQQGR